MSRIDLMQSLPNDGLKESDRQPAAQLQPSRRRPGGRVHTVGDGAIALIGPNPAH